MKASLERKPVAAFSIAPSPRPDAVDEAYADFERLGTRYGELIGELDDAKAELVQADRDAIRNAADALTAGREPKDIDKARDKVEARIIELGRKITAAEIAVDEAGNRLAEAIGKHRAEWLEKLAASEEQATRDLGDALLAARRALQVLGPARRAREWVQKFDVGQARVGKQQQCSVGRIRVDTSNVRRETDGDAFHLLDVLNQAIEPPAAPKPRKHVVSTR